MSYNDPFSSFMASMWLEVKKHKPLANIIPPANMVEVVDTRSEMFYNPQRPLMCPAEGPLLVLLPEASEAQLVSDNAGSMFSMSYSWNIFTDKFKVSVQLFPVLWELFRAVAKAKTAAYNFQYGGDRYVQSVELSFGQFNNPQFFSRSPGTMELQAWRSAIDMTAIFSLSKAQMNG